MYKLDEIQRRCNVLRPGMSVLDLGASPGSWTMLALKLVKSSGRVTAVDIKPEMPTIDDRRFTFLQGDIFDRQTVETLYAAGPFDVVMSDAAPSTTGNKAVDAARSCALAEQAVAIAEATLAVGGNIVVKIFQGDEHDSLFDRVQRIFDTARRIKPEASRKESYELFFVGTGRKPVV